MFGLRWRTESANQTKNGPAHHSTTGVASASSTHGWTSAGSGGKPSIVIASSASDSGTEIQNRRAMSRYSRIVVSSSAVGTIGSRCMPQIGQRPGLSRTISGCIGHVYWAPPDVWRAGRCVAGAARARARARGRVPCRNFGRRYQAHAALRAVRGAGAGDLGMHRAHVAAAVTGAGVGLVNGGSSVDGLGSCPGHSSDHRPNRLP